MPIPFLILNIHFLNTHESNLLSHKGVVNHLVVTCQFPLQGIITTFVVNGETFGTVNAANYGSNFNAQSWDFGSYLYLLSDGPGSNYGRKNTWNGTLYLFAMYAKVIFDLAIHSFIAYLCITEYNVLMFFDKDKFQFDISL